MSPGWDRGRPQQCAIAFGRELLLLPRSTSLRLFRFPNAKIEEYSQTKTKLLSHVMLLKIHFYPKLWDTCELDFVKFSGTCFTKFLLFLSLGTGRVEQKGHY